MKRQKRTSYGIIGLGRFGQSLAETLVKLGADVMVLDRDESKISELREITENAFVVKSLDKKTLSEIGLQNCDIVVVCMGENTDTSVLTVMKLFSIGVPHVIAKATSPDHGEVLKKLGAEVVFPEQDMAVRLANRLEVAQNLDFIQLSEKVGISKTKVLKEFVGKSILECDIRKKFGLNIIAIDDGDDVIDTIVPSYVFKENDILFLAGGKSGISKLSEHIEECDEKNKK